MMAAVPAVSLPDSELAWIVAALALAWAIGVTIFKSGKGFSTAMTAMESRLAQTIAETARDLEDRQDKSTAMFGESVKAVREQMVINEKQTVSELHQLSDQIRKVEIWARDEFVRKDSFREICARIETAVESVREAIMAIATGRQDGRDHRQP